jgi:hypothetical protein
MRAHRPVVTSYKETTYVVGNVKITFQLAQLGPDAHRARDSILIGITRYLSEDPTVASLLASDVEKGTAFLGGVVETVNGRSDPDFWIEDDAGEIATTILREAARRGMAGLYLASGRDSMAAAME